MRVVDGLYVAKHPRPWVLVIIMDTNVFHYHLQGCRIVFILGSREKYRRLRSVPTKRNLIPHTKGDETNAE